MTHLRGRGEGQLGPIARGNVFTARLGRGQGLLPRAARLGLGPRQREDPGDGGRPVGDRLTIGRVTERKTEPLRDRVGRQPRHRRGGQAVRIRLDLQGGGVHIGGVLLTAGGARPATERRQRSRNHRGGNRHHRSGDAHADQHLTGQRGGGFDHPRPQHGPRRLTGKRAGLDRLCHRSLRGERTQQCGHRGRQRRNESRIDHPHRRAQNCAPQLRAGGGMAGRAHDQHHAGEGIGAAHPQHLRQGLTGRLQGLFVIGLAPGQRQNDRPRGRPLVAAELDDAARCVVLSDVQHQEGAASSEIRLQLVSQSVLHLHQTSRGIPPVE